MGIGRRALAGALALAACSARAEAPGLRDDVAFRHPSPLTRNDTLAQRMLTPLLAEAMGRRLRAAGGSPEALAVDVARERFELYVPPGDAPAAGYGLLVFVPPWETAGVPRAWIPVLARAGMIAVSADRSGNGQNVLARRVPLALAAWENVNRDYRLDPARVYVAGFSGGGRVALRIALAFPDVFRGAVLNAGSDPLGSPEVALPDPALFERFARDTRLVYATGTRDTDVASIERRSESSARELCVANLANLPIQGGVHAPADARTFARALRELDEPRAVRSDADACRTARTAEIERRVAAIEASIDAGRLDVAAHGLVELDARYGGLAAPRSLRLAQRLRDRGVEPDAAP